MWFSLILQLGCEEVSDLLLVCVFQLINATNNNDNKIQDKIKLSTVIHSGTLLSNKISISLKINFREETMETNLSASLNQPHKASRETTKPKKHFISQQGGVRRTSPIID